MKLLNRLVLISVLLWSPLLVAQTISSQEVIEDVQFILKTIEQVHANPYRHISNKEFTQYQKTLITELETIDSISVGQFSVKVMALLAHLNDAHTSIAWHKILQENIGNHRLFPYQLKYRDHQLFILNSESHQQSIRSINGLNADSLYQQARSLIAGEEAFKTEITASIFFPAYLYMIGVLSPYELTFSDETQVTAQALNFEEWMLNSQRQGSPYTFALVGDIGYLQYNSCEGYKEFEIFLRNTFKQLHEEGIDKLLIDITYNLGGNSSLNDLLLRYITKKPYRQMSKRIFKVSQPMKDRFTKGEYDFFGKKFVKQYLRASRGSFIETDELRLTNPKTPKYFFEGKVAVMIGPRTFSSANMLADAIKVYDLAKLFGQPTGELTNDFGEQVQWQTPNSQLPFSCTFAYDIGADGNKDTNTTVVPHVVTDNPTKAAIDWLISKEVLK